jgi:Protein of unknown function (DUF2752)
LEITFLPNSLLCLLTSDARIRVHLNYALSAGFLFLLFITVNPANALSFIPRVCLFRELFSIPCPGCGITASLVAAVRGDFHYAWATNPAGLAVGAHLLSQLIAGLIGMLDMKHNNALILFTRRSSQATLTALLLVWVVRIF